MFYIMCYGMVFLYGITIGSFLNVCIYRIPQGRSVIHGRSSCMNCKESIRWYDLIPVISFTLLHGKCRNCKCKLSIQYPMIELINGILYVFVFIRYGWNIHAVLSALLISCLIVVTVIDWRTYTINLMIPIFISLLGIMNMLLVFQEQRVIAAIYPNLLGAIIVSGFLLFLYLCTSGKGVGMGDISLMAGAGLFLGWKLIVLAFLFGAILGAVIHSIRMRVDKSNHVLAFGPYLSIGIVIAVFFGTDIIQWYINTMF